MREHLQARVKRQKLNYDTKLNEKRFRVNDFVWLTNSKTIVGKTRKLLPVYEGPYLIVQKLSDRTYVIQDKPEGKLSIVHHDRMYQYHGDRKSWRNDNMNNLTLCDESLCDSDDNDCDEIVCNSDTVECDEVNRADATSGSGFSDEPLTHIGWQRARTL